MTNFGRLFQIMAGLKYIETECRDFILDRDYLFKGIIEEKRSAENSLIIRESGAWVFPDNKKIKGTNTYRLSAADDRNLNLEHLRLGEKDPVFLLSFNKKGDNWVCESPHICGADSYYADIKFSDDAMELEWRIKGPNKDMHIKTRYFSRQ